MRAEALDPWVEGYLEYQRVTSARVRGHFQRLGAGAG